jgi:hypothetical protein
MKLFRKFDFFTFKEPIGESDWADFGISIIFHAIPRSRRGRYLGTFLVTRGIRLKFMHWSWAACVSYHSKIKIEDL